ncbi:MAG: hypothetical protein EOO39_38295 [Cytophagaceae bacterium]|nr:MAG: hypothetical protein EOO39_38295 [Cytophagaceae bacterium]
MYKLINKTCPQCQQPFQARRKNQLYCTNECRYDANNAVAKNRYHTAKEEGPQLVKLRQKVKRLEEHIASLVVVISAFKLNADTLTLTYAERRYKRVDRRRKTEVGVNLDTGLALLMPGGKTIICRSETFSPEMYYEFVLDPS